MLHVSGFALCIAVHTLFHTWSFLLLLGLRGADTVGLPRMKPLWAFRTCLLVKSVHMLGFTSDWDFWAIGQWYVSCTHSFKVYIAVPIYTPIGMQGSLAVPHSLQCLVLAVCLMLALPLSVCRYLPMVSVSPWLMMLSFLFFFFSGEV